MFDLLTLFFYAQLQVAEFLRIPHDSPRTFMMWGHPSLLDQEDSQQKTKAKDVMIAAGYMDVDHRRSAGEQCSVDPWWPWWFDDQFGVKNYPLQTGDGEYQNHVVMSSTGNPVLHKPVAFGANTESEIESLGIHWWDCLGDASQTPQIAENTLHYGGVFIQ